MDTDPVVTNPAHYRVLFENARVRVLEYEDAPGDVSVRHSHPDSVMVTLSSFTRRLHGGEQSIDVELPEGTARWLPAQSHYGENTGDTPTRAIFVELLEPSTAAQGGPQALGPQSYV